MSLDAALPHHPRTGLQAVGFRRNGAPIWPILGAEDETDAEKTARLKAEADAKAAADAKGADDGADGLSDDERAALGDPGKQAIDRMKTKWQAEREQRRERDAELERLRAELAEAKKPAKAADGADEDRRKAFDDAVKAAQDNATRDATAAANQRIIKAEVKAAAAGKLANPALALKLLDLSKLEVDADGNVDEDEVAELIDNLLKKEPYLAAQGRSKFQGGADGGQQNGGGAKPKQLSADDVKRMSPEQIVEAQKKGQLDDYLAS